MTTTEKLTLTLGITTQMEWTNDCIGEGWEIITNGTTSGPSPDHPRYGERLHTIRVDETCPHHEELNYWFNKGGVNACLKSGVFTPSKASSNIYQTSPETICEVLRYLVADGRFGISLTISDNDVDGEEVKSLGLPKSVAKDASKKTWISEDDKWADDTDYYDPSNWGFVDAVQVAYKVNGSTGERNETGEKRVNRVLKELDRYLTEL